MKNITRILLLFIFAHLLGLVVGNAFFVDYSNQTFGEANWTVQDIFFIIVGMVFFLLLILLILKIYKGDLLFKLLESVIVFVCSSIVFLGILWYFNGSILTAFFLAFMFTILKFFLPNLRNISGIFLGVGMAVMFALFLSLFEAFLFIVFMCFYDFLAVFVTRHMIVMATEFSKRNLSFSLASKENVKVQKTRSYYVVEEGVKREVIEKYTEEKPEHLELGTGDITLPLAFNLVVFKTVVSFNEGIVFFIFMSIFSTLSLGYLLYFVKKYKLFLPALPPIILGTFTGLLLTIYGLGLKI